MANVWELIYKDQWWLVSLQRFVYMYKRKPQIYRKNEILKDQKLTEDNQGDFYKLTRVRPKTNCSSK